MSKKRLHEIAKEIGKSSKEVVEHAKYLGLDVKSHASSVEEADAKKIISSFSKASKPDVTASQTVKPKEVAQSSVTVVKETGSEHVEKTQVSKPKSRNFKAEREARAKEQAARKQANGSSHRSQERRGGYRQPNNHQTNEQGDKRITHRSQGDTNDKRIERKASNVSPRHDNHQLVGDPNRSFAKENQRMVDSQTKKNKDDKSLNRKVLKLISKLVLLP
ncbi:translation initiation factor IF-2 [Streptococcus pyogenes]|nr:translation initiation factor IF-2 [Streptococcus pyogenes]